MLIFKCSQQSGFIYPSSKDKHVNNGCLNLDSNFAKFALSTIMKSRVGLLIMTKLARSTMWQEDSWPY